MTYQTFEPCEQLASFVKCYWTLEDIAGENQQKQTIVPDGCMEMIFHLGEGYRQYFEDGSSTLQPKCFVFGQLTRPLEIEPTGSINIFSVRFHPNGFLPFATIPVKEMENRAVSLENLFRDEGKRIETDVLSAENTAGEFL